MDIQEYIKLAKERQEKNKPIPIKLHIESISRNGLVKVIFN